MKVAIFSTQPFEKEVFDKINHNRHQLTFFQESLSENTKHLVQGFDAICVFVNDTLSASVIAYIAKQGIFSVALRSAGFNHVDLKACEQYGVSVTRVPEYSPYAVAEHTVALLLALNRKIHKAYNRVREGNFSLDGLVGQDLHGQTVGVVGTGKIGSVFASIMLGFGCRVLAVDLHPNSALIEKGVVYTTLEEVCKSSTIVSLHVPLNQETHHMINQHTLFLMHPHVILLNTSRGGLIDTQALIHALKKKKIKAAGLDVYEEEEHLFFHDLSNTIIEDDQIARLMTFPNVLITAHQAFLTEEALANIAQTTLLNLDQLERKTHLTNQILFT